MDISCFPWYQLITSVDLNGGKNFEAIAFEYVKSEFPTYSWEKTQQTHDGNKDAYAFVSIFSTKESFEEMWMEAKYSKEKKRMSRYYIDKTIVSALISKKVCGIIFVTNMLVSEKVKEEILKALSIDGLGNAHILFRTKYDLEVWLTNTEKGRKIFQQYFKGLYANNFQIKGLQVLGEMSFYEKEMNDYLYLEPVHILETKKPYMVCARIYSPCEAIISISPSNTQDFLIAGGQDIRVCQGVSDIKFYLTILSYTQSHFSLFLTGTTLSTEYKELLPVKEPHQYRIQTQSQERVLKDLVSTFNDYVLFKISKLFCIAGREGMGKTYLLKRFLENKSLRHQYVLYYQFVNSSIENSRALVELYLRLFYVYASIKTFPVNEILYETCKEAVALIDERDNERITTWMRDTATRQLLPSSYRQNRIIILDNTELLSEEQKLFLHQLIVAIISSSGKSFIVTSGRTPFIGIKVHWLYFTADDLTYSLLHHPSFHQSELLSARTNLLASVINNISSLLFFWNMVEEGANFQNFAHLIKKQTMEKVVSSRIERYFNTLVSRPKTKDLLILIYLLRSGLSYGSLMDEDKDSISELLSINLIAEGYYGYEPVSGLFCECFRQTVVAFDNNSDVFRRYSAKLSSDEALRISLSSSKRLLFLMKVNERTDTLMQDYDYQTIVYLMEPLFSEFSEVQRDDETWHYLQFKYIYAKANIDSEFHIVNEFLSFSQKLENSNKSSDLYLRIYALSEVCCFQFEEADIKEALNTASKVEGLMGCCNEVPLKVREALWLCQATRILTLCAVDKFEEAKQQLENAKMIWTKHKYAVTQLRYARYLFHTNPDKARALIEESLPVLSANNDYKWEPAGRFLLSFLDYLSGNKETIHNQVQIIKRDFSQYASLHRSNLRLIAALQLVENHSDNNTKKDFRELWDEYLLLSETRFKKEQGQDDMIEGAYEYLWGNNDEMKLKMEAALLIFEQFGNSYKKIILHNYSLREDTPYKRVKFYNDDIPMDDDCYYLDPRFW